MPPWATSSPGGSGCSCGADDFGAMLSRVVAAGCEVVRPARTESYGEVCVFRDPASACRRDRGSDRSPCEHERSESRAIAGGSTVSSLQLFGASQSAAGVLVRASTTSARLPGPIIIWVKVHRGRRWWRRDQQDAPGEHVASFEHATVYFQYVFAGPPRSLGKVADLLLRAGIAETVSSPVDGQVRMSPRYDKLATKLQEMERVAEFSRLLDEGGRARDFWRAHPKLFLRTLAISVLSRFNWRQRDGDPQSTPEGAYDVGENLKRVAEEIRIGVAGLQAVPAVQHVREWDLYQPSYLLSEPYIRLQLRSVSYGLADLDGLSPGGQTAEALLMVHRSGVFQLLLPCVLPPGIRTDDLIERQISDQVQLKWAEVAEPVLREAQPVLGVDEWTGEWLPGITEGVRWRRLESVGSVGGLFQIYLAALEGVLGFRVEGNSWHCYATSFLQPRCCKDEEAFHEKHSRELMGILARHYQYEELRDSGPVRPPRNSAIATDHSAWIGDASATIIDWANLEDRRRFDSHLWTLLLVESYLLQNWQMRLLLWRVATPTSAESVRDLQWTLVTGLGEFYSSELAFGTAADIADELRRESGMDRMHQQVVERIAQLGELTAVERAEQAATRSLLAALAAAVAAVVLALPALSATLNAASASPDSGVLGWLIRPVRWLSGHGSSGLWWSYFGMLGLLGLAWTVTALVMRAKRRRRWSRSHSWTPVGSDWVDGSVTVTRQAPRKTRPTG